MNNKVKFKKITDKELKGLALIITDYINDFSFINSNFSELTISYVLYDLNKKKIYNLLEVKKTHTFSLPVHQASAVYVALSKSKYDDYFSQHVVRKFQTIIENNFLNKI